MIDSRFVALFRNRISEIRKAQVEFITGGIDQYPSYREAVGFIKALDLAVSLIDEVQQDMMKGQ